MAKHVLLQARGEAADENKLAKLLGDGKLTNDEIKGVVAGLHFILVSSAKFDVAAEVLTQELQQLGLPKEHTEALVVALRDACTPLQQHLADSSLRLPKLESLRWDVDADPSQGSAHAVVLQLTTRAQAPPKTEPAMARSIDVRLSTDMLSMLHASLKSARELIPPDAS